MYEGSKKKQKRSAAPAAMLFLLPGEKVDRAKRFSSGRGPNEGFCPTLPDGSFATCGFDNMQQGENGEAKSR
jgi:hypothetical protein